MWRNFVSLSDQFELHVLLRQLGDIDRQSWSLVLVTSGRRSQHGQAVAWLSPVTTTPGLGLTRIKSEFYSSL